MKNEFLNTLFVEMESTKTLDLGDAAEVALEAAKIEVDVLVGLIDSLESNYAQFVAKDEVTMESYRIYEHNVGIILKASGLDVPVGLIVPSFESAEDDPKADAKEKKDNVIVRAAKALYKAIKELIAKVRDFFTKKSESVKELEKVIGEVETFIKGTKRYPIKMMDFYSNEILESSFVSEFVSAIKKVLEWNEQRAKLLSGYKPGADIWNKYEELDDKLAKDQQALSDIVVRSDPKTQKRYPNHEPKEFVGRIRQSLRYIKDLADSYKEFARRYDAILKKLEEIPESVYTDKRFPTEIGRVIKDVKSDRTVYDKIIKNTANSLSEALNHVKKVVNA